jgi:uncharacterized protein
VTDVDTLELADRFFAAIEAGDVDVLRQLYDPDVEIWHNTDGVAQRLDDNLATLAWMGRNLHDLRYTSVRRAQTTDGFVQQHVLVATNRAGRRVEVPACIVTKVGEDGRITHLDEYLDSAAVAAILEK